jgi:hypothetical protein
MNVDLKSLRRKHFRDFSWLTMPPQEHDIPLFNKV